jgi:hypothetical protein
MENMGVRRDLGATGSTLISRLYGPCSTRVNLRLDMVNTVLPIFGAAEDADGRL